MKRILLFFLSFMLLFLVSCSEGSGGSTASTAPEAIGEDTELVHISDFDVNLYVGQSYQLSASVLQENHESHTFTWSSSRPEVCSADDGLVVALSEGISVVTVKTENDKSASVKVTVYGLDKLKSIILSDLDIELEVGSTYDLTASVRPSSDSPYLPITWSTTDENIATVDSNGMVTVHAEGAFLVMADIEGVARAVCKVNGADLASIVEVAVNDVPKNYKRTDLHGNTIVEASITSYEIYRELTADGKVKVVVRIYGTKTFDKDDDAGVYGENAVYIKAAVYEIFEEVEEYKGYYSCSSGSARTGEEFELSVTLFYDTKGWSYHTPKDELTFDTDIKANKEFKLILDYGEEGTAE